MSLCLDSKLTRERTLEPISFWKREVALFFHLLIYVFCSIFIIAKLIQIVCELILIMLRHTLPITPMLDLYCQYFNICILKMTKLGGIFEVLIQKPEIFNHLFWRTFGIQGFFWLKTFTVAQNIDS